MRERDEREMRERKETSETVRQCGRKIRNRMPKSDDKTESNLRRGRREGRWEQDKEEARGGGERGGGGGSST